MGKILVIDDDPDIRELLRYNLAREGFSPVLAASGEEGLREAEKRLPPRLVLLDLMLPDLDGLEVCRLIKKSEKTQSIPILMVSARGEEQDVVTGLELGADDYVVKPFSPRILMARIRSLLRRGGRLDSRERAACGPFSLDREKFSAQAQGKNLELTVTEFRILFLLVSHPGKVFTRQQILDAARGEDVMVVDRTIDVHVASLRKKLGRHAGWIETLHGVGYRMREEGEGSR